MNFLIFLSDVMIPLVLCCVLTAGILTKVDLYHSFVTGAKKGMSTVVQIMPTLIGLMLAVGILRASGFLDALGNVLAGITSKIDIPESLIPLSLVKMFSSSAATGMLLDIFKESGTDSRAGLMGSLMMCSTETIFYTMSIYYMTVKVSKTRWTLWGALLASLAGIAASVILVKFGTGFF